MYIQHSCLSSHSPLATTHSYSPPCRPIPLGTELPKQYDHAAAQAAWYPFWEERGYFHSEPNPARQPYTIVIPPPNVTGALHLGHALNNTLQDILIRQKRMQGFETLWLPGTDHAGIATQAVVERRLLEEEKLSRHELGRQGLVDRIWQWKNDYEARIIGQLKQMGCSCDWQRTRFTLDEVCARAVRETFFTLFKEGKIYRGKRLVNWDTFLQTAVSDDEVFHEAVKGHFWHFKYPVRRSQAGRADARHDRHDAARNHAGRHGRGRASRSGRRARTGGRRPSPAVGRRPGQGEAGPSGPNRRSRAPAARDAAAIGKAPRHGPPWRDVGTAADRPARFR